MKLRALLLVTALAAAAATGAAAQAPLTDQQCLDAWRPGGGLLDPNTGICTNTAYNDVCEDGCKAAMQALDPACLSRGAVLAALAPENVAGWDTATYMCAGRAEQPWGLLQLPTALLLQPPTGLRSNAAADARRPAPSLPQHRRAGSVRH